MDPLYRLNWSGHQSTIVSYFSSLLALENMTDVTLAAEGAFVKAHRHILSACSPYFQSLLNSSSQNKEPIIFLKDVPFIHLQALIAFMYQGEVKVPKEELLQFLKTAEALQIRGLSENSNLLTGFINKKSSSNVIDPSVPQRVSGGEDPSHGSENDSLENPKETRNPEENLIERNNNFNINNNNNNHITNRISEISGGQENGISEKEEGMSSFTGNEGVDPKPESSFVNSFLAIEQRDEKKRKRSSSSNLEDLLQLRKQRLRALGPSSPPPGEENCGASSSYCCGPTWTTGLADKERSMDTAGRLGNFVESQIVAIDYPQHFLVPKVDVDSGNNNFPDYLRGEGEKEYSSGEESSSLNQHGLTMKRASSQFNLLPYENFIMLADKKIQCKLCHAVIKETSGRNHLIYSCRKLPLFECQFCPCKIRNEAYLKFVHEKYCAKKSTEEQLYDQQKYDMLSQGQQSQPTQQ